LMNSGVDLDQIQSNLDFISGDGFIRIATASGTNYLKRDFLFVPGEWRGSRIQCIPLAPWRFFDKNLVTGHSDIMTTTRNLRWLKLMGVKHVFGTNTIPVAGFSTSLPLGLTNDCDDSPIHRILGDTSHILRAHQSTNFTSTYNGTIYVNFTSANNHSVRARALGFVRQLENIVYGEMVFSESGRVQYLSSLRSNSFVLCPEGNGVDTHRLWETLYMGGIPIVVKTQYLSDILAILPVVQLNDWSELGNQKYLESEWHRVQNKKNDFNLLKLSYWSNVLGGKVA
jgi:hypothetical protein